MRALRELLVRRGEQNELINVAVVGSGWFGSGVIREFYRWPAIVPRVILTRTTDRALRSLLHAGASRSDIEEVHTQKEYKQALKKGKFIISENLGVMEELDGIDVVFEATGDVKVGVETGLYAIRQGIHYITANIEMDGTVGFAIEKLSHEHGVVYSASDGDQPCELAQMIDEVKLYGCTIVVAGSCKGFLDVHQNPEGVTPWVRPGHNPRMITAFADGTKQGLELAVLANGTELVPDIRGMHGPTTTKVALVDDFLKIIRQEGIVDYVMGITGINQAGGIFVVAKREDEFVADDFDYLKKGKGPYYLFFRDHHLCYFAAARSVAEAVLFNVRTLPHRKKVADVFSVAKRDLKAGERLDGIGGATVYGLIDRAEVVHKENLLPVGLSEYAVLTRNADKDTPITCDMVDIAEDNVVVQIRRKEDEIVTCVTA